MKPLLLSLFFLAHVLLPVQAIPGRHTGRHSRLPVEEKRAPAQPVCRLILSVLETTEDFSTKVHGGDVHQPVKYLAISDTSPGPIGLLPRQADDPYSCSQSKSCRNGAHCAKTGVCNYGPNNACGTSGQSPNDECVLEQLRRQSRVRRARSHCHPRTDPTRRINTGRREWEEVSAKYLVSVPPFRLDDAFPLSTPLARRVKVVPSSGSMAPLLTSAR